MMHVENGYIWTKKVHDHTQKDECSDNLVVETPDGARVRSSGNVVRVSHAIGVSCDIYVGSKLERVVLKHVVDIFGVE